ncbi:hypothetical protein GGS20DRAFT_29431 [Poronia punctata]|nr:hypothetical protein GGS20DRAFT_29431 [Poronia punctata]
MMGGSLSVSFSIFRYLVICNLLVCLLLFLDVCMYVGVWMLCCVARGMFPIPFSCLVLCFFSSFIFCWLDLWTCWCICCVTGVVTFLFSCPFASFVVSSGYHNLAIRNHPLEGLVFFFFKNLD